MVEIKNIPIRLQMVIGGQVGAAVLPEPLATLAEMKGARSVLDDAGKGWSVTVLAFKDGFMNQNPTKVKAFLKAVQKASDYINNNPDGVRAIMNRECRMPDQLKQSFAIPRFPMLALPTPGQWQTCRNGSIRRGRSRRKCLTPKWWQMVTSPDLLRVRGLGKTFYSSADSKIVLKDVSFALSRNDSLPSWDLPDAEDDTSFL